MRNRTIAAAAFLAAALLWSRQSKAVEEINPLIDVKYIDWGDDVETNDDFGSPVIGGSIFDDPLWFNDASWWIGVDVGGFGGLPVLSPDDYTLSSEGFDMQYPSEQAARLRAFLFMIRRAEHVESDALSGRCYQIFYGGSEFQNLADHPVITREKAGVPLSPAMCINAGFKSGKCVSTAAGAYQMIKPTWQRVRAGGTWGSRLPDFAGPSQDEAARRLLIECGALPLVLRGEFAAALRKSAQLWASLPGSNAKQNPKDVATVTAFYNQGFTVG